jgi:VCBS repeat protein
MRARFQLGIACAVGFAAAAVSSTTFGNDVPSPAVSVSVGTIDVGHGFRLVVSGRPLAGFSVAVSLFGGSVHTRYGELCLNPRRAIFISDSLFRRHDPPLDDTGHYDRSFFLSDDPRLLGKRPSFQAIAEDASAPHGLSLSRAETRVIGNGSRGDFRGAGIGFLPGQTSYRSPAAGDVDGDGDVDIVVRRPPPLGMTLFLNDGAGTFIDGTSGESTGIPPESRAASPGAFLDVDGDGDQDLLCFGLSTTATQARLRLLVNDGHGQFVDGSDGPTTGTPESCCGDNTALLVGDLDGDGSLDILLTGAGSIYLNDRHGLFRDATFGPASGWTPSGAAGQTGVLGDFDDDGDLDVVLSSRDHAQRLFLNDGHAHFTEVLSGPGTGLPPYPYNEIFTGVLAGDLDRDGHLDLVMITLYGQTRTWMNQGGAFFVDETFAGPNGAGPRLPLWTTHTEGAVLADLDRDGDLDLYMSNWIDGRDRLYLNDGRGFFSDTTGNPQTGASTAWSIGSRARVLDIDGDLDILSDGIGDFGQGLVEVAVLVNR